MTPPEVLTVTVRMRFWDVYRSMFAVLACSKTPAQWLMSALKNFLFVAVLFFALCYAFCGFRESLPLMVKITVTWAALFMVGFPPIFMLLFPPLLLVFLIVTKHAPLLGKPVVYVFSNDGIHVSMETSGSQVPWSNLSQVRETKRWFLFYVRKNVAFILPKDCFADGADIESLRQLVRASFSGLTAVGG